MSDFSKNLDALWKKLEEERLAVNTSGLAEIERLAAAESVLQKEHLAMTSERADWNAEKCEIARTQSFPSHQVTLDVGGERFTTTLATLTRYPKSLIGKMFSGRHALGSNAEKDVFLDRDGKHFRHVLNFLRTPDVSASRKQLNALLENECPSVTIELQSEASFYGLELEMFPPPPPPFKPAAPQICGASYPPSQGIEILVTQGVDKIFNAVRRETAGVRTRLYAVAAPPLCVCTNCKKGETSDGTKISFNFVGEVCEQQPTVSSCRGCGY